MAKYKFPDPDKRSPANPTVLLPAERLLAIYNQETGKEAQRVSKKVQEWARETGHAAGFDGVAFSEDATPGAGRGCIFWKNFNQPAPNVFILVDEPDEEVPPKNVKGSLPPLPKLTPLPKIPR